MAKSLDKAGSGFQKACHVPEEWQPGPDKVRICIAESLWRGPEEKRLFGIGKYLPGVQGGCRHAKSFREIAEQRLPFTLA